MDIIIDTVFTVCATVAMIGLTTLLIAWVGACIYGMIILMFGRQK